MVESSMEDAMAATTATTQINAAKPNSKQSLNLPDMGGIKRPPTEGLSLPHYIWLRLDHQFCFHGF